jgi:hypothetical protein
MVYNLEKMEDFKSVNKLKCAECSSHDLEVQVEISEPKYAPIAVVCRSCGYMTEIARVKKEYLSDSVDVNIGTAIFGQE